jgi:multicomponent K+:H+ antiporter subunit F
MTDILATLTTFMNTVFVHAVNFAQLCFALAMLFATVRLMRGPAAQDRVLALDSLYITGLLTLLTLGIRSQSTAYFDMALLIALFGFVGTLALSRFLLRGEVIEP